MGGLSLADKAHQGELTEADFEFLHHLDNPRVLQKLYSQNAIMAHKNSNFRINIQTQDIRNRRSNRNFVKAKSVLDNGDSHTRVEIDCVIFLSDWSKLENARESHINILDYFQNLYSNKERGIGLCTFQNGIQNTMEDFEAMGEKILEKFEYQKPICVIGFYNQTSGWIYGMVDDLLRLSAEWNLNVHSLLTMRQMICTLSKYLPKNVLWAHFCHSEGGLIAKEVVTTTKHSLSFNEGNFAKKQLITVSYGAVDPIPDYVLEAINTYSIKDITMLFAIKYLDKLPKPAALSDEVLKIWAKEVCKNPMVHKTPDEILAELKSGTIRLNYIDEYPHESKKDGYTITLVESLGGYGLGPQGDHEFAGLTYQAALERNIDYLKKKHRFL